jgi:hypothetical protein
MNKFFILIAASLFTYGISSAQTEKGTQNLGLNFGFSINNANDFTIYPSDNSTTTLNSKTTTFNFGPNYSYFIADNLDIGAALSYSSSTTTNTTEAFATNNANYPVRAFSNNYGGSVYIRKYYLYKNTIGFRTGGYLGFSGGTSKNTYTTSNALYNFNSTTNYYSGGANVDLVYYPSKKLGISATIANLEYYHYNADNTTQGHDSGDSFSFNFINSGLSLSVFYVFGSK